MMPPLQQSPAAPVPGIPRTPTGRFVAALFDALEAQDIVYCVLRNHEALPDQPSGDIDILVPRAALCRVPAAVRAACVATGWGVHAVGRHANVSRGLYASDPADPANTVALEFRALLLVMGDSWPPQEHSYIPPDQVLATRRRAPNGVFVPAPAHTACHLLVEALAVGKGRYWEPIRRALAEDPEGGARVAERLLGGDLAGRLLPRLAAGDRDAAWPLRTEVRAAIFARHPPSAVERLVHDASAVAGRLAGALWPRGLVVAILGPDGVGKTTAADAVARRLHRSFPGVRRVHYGVRPAVLPGKRRAQAAFGQPERAPAGPKPRVKGSGAYGSVRLLYHILDYWVDRIMRLGTWRAKGQLVVGERWSYDYVASPARHNPDAWPWVRAVVPALSPAPDLVILLDAAPAAVRTRKQELDEEAIARELTAFKAAGARIRHFAVVDADQPLDAVVDAVTAEILRCARGRQGR